jgi:hypothetical protein
MICHICSSETAELRSVMLRAWLEPSKDMSSPPGPESAAYHQYVRNMTFRRAFICENCYRTIDAAPAGVAEIAGLGEWNLAGLSRHGAAAIYDRQKWERFQRNKAKDMGIDW